MFVILQPAHTTSLVCQLMNKKHAQKTISTNNGAREMKLISMAAQMMMNTKVLILKRYPTNLQQGTIFIFETYLLMAFSYVFLLCLLGDCFYRHFVKYNGLAPALCVPQVVFIVSVGQHLFHSLKTKTSFCVFYLVPRQMVSPSTPQVVDTLSDGLF